MKLAGDPNNPLRSIRDDITIEELRAEIMAKMRGLRMFEDMAQLPPPEGVVHNGSNGRGPG